MVAMANTNTQYRCFWNEGVQKSGDILEILYKISCRGVNGDLVNLFVAQRLGIWSCSRVVIGSYGCFNLCVTLRYLEIN